MHFFLKETDHVSTGNKETGTSFIIWYDNLSYDLICVETFISM